MPSFELSFSRRTFSLVFLFLWLVLAILVPVIFTSALCFSVHAQLVASVEAKHDRKSSQRAITCSDPDLCLSMAKEMAESGDYRSALSILSPFASFPMKYPTIYSDYIVILFWDGRVDEAISMYDSLPASFPKRGYLLRNMAKAHYERDEFQEAVMLYENALRQTPSDEEAQKGLVLSFIRLGDFRKASNYLERFLEKAPDSSALAPIRAHLLIKQGRYLEGLREYDSVARRTDIEADQVYRVRDDLIASTGVEERKRILDALAIAAQQGDEQAICHHILVLTLCKDYNGAVKSLEASDIDTNRCTDHFLAWIAWAYFKIGKTREAKAYYEKILARRPSYVRARIGLAYCLSVDGDDASATDIVDKLLLVDPKSVEIRFARAFVHERAGRLWSAIAEYDHILRLSPENTVAHELKLRTLSDLGASSHALQEGQKNFPDNSELHYSIRGDMAVDLIHWDEPEKAIHLLSLISEDTENLRFRFDYVNALAESNQNSEVVRVYQNLCQEGISPPPWTLEDVAGAYLYLEEPYKALELYDEALKASPNSFEGRMGKFNVLQELREWEKARKVLDDLDQMTPEFLGEGKNAQPNWPKLEVTIARGWALAREDRLGEAEDFFYDLYERAPANTDIRNGLAHVHLWRGWPRKALKEFRIIETLDPEYMKAKTGKMAALNELAFREEARDEASTLLKTHFKNKYLQQLCRQFEVEEMREIVADFRVFQEPEGSDDIRAEISFYEPVSVSTSLCAAFLWRKTWEDDDSSNFRRAGMGVNHIFNSTWEVEQRVSVNYDDGRDFGSFSEIRFFPSDYFRFSISYDSFTTDVPMQARVFEIEAKKLDLGIEYRESEWRSCHLFLGHLEFSDGNDRDQALLGYEQGLFVKNNWSMKLGVELYMSRNSRDDAPYFNPEKDFSLSATHVTEQTLWRIYDRAFVHRLHLTVGSYKQADYSHEMIGSIRYEQDYDFSDTHSLLWGATLGSNVYDGDAVTNYGFYLTYRWRF